MDQKPPVEIELMIAGEALTLRPTGRALAEIEAATGLSMEELIDTITKEPMTLKIEQAAIVFWATARAASPWEKRTVADFGELIIQGGMQSVIEPVMEVAMTCLYGSEICFEGE